MKRLLLKEALVLDQKYVGKTGMYVWGGRDYLVEIVGVCEDKMDEVTIRFKSDRMHRNVLFNSIKCIEAPKSQSEWEDVKSQSEWEDVKASECE